jgi:hypothetical protein
MQKCCANCFYFIPQPKKQAVDPLQGNCLGGIPQVISYIQPPAVAGAPAQLQVMSIDPTVAGQRPACATYKPIAEEQAANAA